MTTKTPTPAQAEDEQIKLLCEVLGTEQYELFVMSAPASLSWLYELGSEWTNNDSGARYRVVGQFAA